MVLNVNPLSGVFSSHRHAHVLVETYLSAEMHYTIFLEKDVLSALPCSAEAECFIKNTTTERLFQAFHEAEFYRDR